MGGRTFGCALAAAIGCGLLGTPAAEASFHLIDVREVYPGGAEDSYVELQMYAEGETLLKTHSLTLYDSTGALVHTSTFSTNLANGENQSTALVGDSGVQSAFGVAPDLVDSALSLPAGGGAACWNAGGFPADCVAWGSFSGGASLQSATGSPVSPSGITVAKAIRRTIEPGCPTLLESGDDTNHSAADFFETTPSPRNNSSPIIEKSCAGAPETTIAEKPANPVNSNSAKFTYSAPTATSFECKLDAAAFAACPGTGVEYTGLGETTHSFEVRGVNASAPDPTPAGYSWRVDLTPPTSTIDTHPEDPSSGASAKFTFHASETGSKFQCSLALEGEADAFSSCTSGRTYTNLADGNYTFKVSATDQAGNQQATPTTFTWTVDNSVADTTPPETKIDSFPPDPSTSTTAAFTYESNEPGSSFECTLDGGLFSFCPTSGVVYSGLAAGPHLFQVRATDSSANVDPTPAGYSFTVVLPLLPPPLASTPTPATAPIPETRFSQKPPAKSRDRTPTFRFRADPAGARFECGLDRLSFRGCRSPFTPKPLRPGRHRFSVRAVLAGVPDPTPAQFGFRVMGAG
jgi:hypothetical protein